MAQNDTSRIAVCEEDTIKLAKMGEELDAAAEYIDSLHEQIGQLKQAADAKPQVDPETENKLEESLGIIAGLRKELAKANETIVLLDLEKEQIQPATVSEVSDAERADRAALMQVAYRLDQDNPGMSLQEALPYISGAFTGEADLPVLEPLPEVEYLDAAEFGSEEDSQDGAPESQHHFEEAYAEAPTVDTDFAPWAPPEFDEPAQAFEPELETASFPEAQMDPEEDYDAPLPGPVSAAGVVNGDQGEARAVPSGPDDTNWDPSAWVPPKDEAEELSRLLEQFETPTDEVYGIAAYAQEHPELFKKD